MIAGHETTSGLLSFATYFLLQNPDVLQKAYEEVDRVFGADTRREPTYRQVTELRYVKQVLNESLRLWPTAPMFALFPKEGRTVIGGRYEISKRDAIAVLVPMLHRDASVWGSAAETFDPDNFAPEREAALPANAFKPFGNGQRACIGRQFAMHEATLAMGLILQRFNLHDHTNYELAIKETLTLKPKGFRLRLSKRKAEALPNVEDEAQVATDPGTAPSESGVPSISSELVPQHGTSLLVLFGSNMGTAESAARRIGDSAERRGFDVTVAPLDDYTQRLKGAGAVLIITASYNGRPPDNATRFVEWLEAAQPEELSELCYAVFGCGHRDWASTYQHVPKQIDARLMELGAVRLMDRGEGDGGGDFDGDFEKFHELLWPTLASEFDLDLEVAAGVKERVLYEVEVIDEVHPNPFVAQFKARPMVVVENRELQAPESERSTRHIELALPSGVEYRTGDHLGVIAQNDEALVKRVASRFGFDEQTRIRVHNRGAGHSEFPLGQTISVFRILTDYVELQDPATRSQIKTLAEHTECPHTRASLLALCDDGDGSASPYLDQVLEKRKSLIDLLDEFPACEVPFGVYLGLLPPLRPRYYSISSSPAQFARICSLTVGVVEGPARSGHGTYRGVCSNYLGNKPKGSTVYAFVRKNTSGFEPPRSPAVPIIMVGPGTGIAPFRGFLQERAWHKAQGTATGDAMLFFGCRNESVDFLYREELEQCVSQGTARLFLAFSRSQEEKIYVQDRIREYGEEVWALIERGAHIFVCGDATEMAPAVRTAFGSLHTRFQGGGDAEAEAFLQELEERGRYRVDVWASS